MILILLYGVVCLIFPEVIFKTNIGFWLLCFDWVALWLALLQTANNGR